MFPFYGSTLQEYGIGLVAFDTLITPVNIVAKGLIAGGWIRLTEGIGDIFTQISVIIDAQVIQAVDGTPFVESYPDRVLNMPLTCGYDSQENTVSMLRFNPQFPFNNEFRVTIENPSLVTRFNYELLLLYHLIQS